MRVLRLKSRRKPPEEPLILVSMRPYSGDLLIEALADAHSALTERADARGAKNKADRAATERDRFAARYMTWAQGRIAAAKQ